MIDDAGTERAQLRAERDAAMAELKAQKDYNEVLQCKRLGPEARSAERYWEARWRDEAQAVEAANEENARLRETLKPITDEEIIEATALALYMFVDLKTGNSRDFRGQAKYALAAAGPRIIANFAARAAIREGGK